jgi:hypothetical protein
MDMDYLVESRVDFVVDPVKSYLALSFLQSKVLPERGRAETKQNPMIAKCSDLTQPNDLIVPTKRASFAQSIALFLT